MMGITGHEHLEYPCSPSGGPCKSTCPLEPTEPGLEGSSPSETNLERQIAPGHRHLPAMMVGWMYHFDGLGLREID